MLLSVFALIIGLGLLVWSADRFVEGAAATAKYLGIPSLLIGMLVIGFGTSAPEMIVSVFASLQGNSGIALGNAYGSNIANIAMVLGITALLQPIVVQSQVLKKELPLLLGVSGLAYFWASDLTITRMEAVSMLVLFVLFMAWSAWISTRTPEDPLALEADMALAEHHLSKKQSILWMIIGLIILVLSSRLLVWGAVNIAHHFGVSDLIIGLTIIAIGTSLPELAASISAVLKKEDDLAIGNVLGSNIFNLLAVVGIAGGIGAIQVSPEIISRDIPIMLLLTVSLFLSAYRFKAPGRINRVGGGGLVVFYVTYLVSLAQ